MSGKPLRFKINSNDITGYLLISPWLIGFAVFTLFPLISSFLYSLTEYNLLSSPEFVGVGNYLQAFEDGRFYQSFKVTFTYALVHVPLKIFFA